VTSAFKSLRGEVGRAELNARPIGPPRALRREGDDLVNHDSVERAVNHQGVRDSQHRIAVSNDQRLGLGEAVTAGAIGLLRFSFASLNAGSTCAISARCSTTRGSLPHPARDQVP
jgi:hypothetical protein